ncbi:MAG: (d)CMP kinase [Thermoplasmata archaeon]|nr:AAA family ATPase [Thermoplasmata archaeon]
MIIIISGPPGSGKTTVARIVSQKLNYPLISSGDIFRSMAKEHNMTVEEFSKLAERDYSFDKKIDERILEIMKRDENLVIDSRLAAWFAKKNGIDAFKIFLNASRDKRLERINKREKTSMQNLILREESEINRYKKIYGIDFRDLSIYDLVLDTDNLTPESIVDKIMESVNKWTK